MEKIEKLSKMVYDAKAKARAIVVEVLKKKGTHTFTPNINRLNYELIGQDGTRVYFKTAEYNDGKVLFNCVDFDGEEVELDFNDFEQDDMTFFDICFDIVGE